VDSWPLPERLSSIGTTRSGAANALCSALENGSQGLSETEIRDRWLAGIRQHAPVLSTGWYEPPPTGACVLIGQPEEGFARLNYESLRHAQTWSRDDIRLRDDSLVYAYASPVHSRSAMIGDLGVTLYRGDDPRIREHLVACLAVTMKTAEFASVGMELREVFHFARTVASEAHVSNVASSTASGIQNIGHTVPFSYTDYPADVQGLLDADEDQAVCTAISAARVSVNAQARLVIPHTMAFTVEPQIRSPTAPLCSYHVIVAFIDGEKRILSDFDEMFGSFGMDGDWRATA
jgi:hypothetical protein